MLLFSSDAALTPPRRSTLNDWSHRRCAVYWIDCPDYQHKPG